MPLQSYLNLVRFHRPVGWLLLLWPSLSALWIAAEGFPGWHLLVVFVLGTVLMRSAGCCMNDVADRYFDRHVRRTATRPITSGVVSVQQALGLGAVLALLAFGLVLTTNVFTVLLAFVALGITLIYPYTKRFFAMPQAVLGLAFGMGIVMAFSAVQNAVPPLAFALLSGNLLWVIAYDTQYAMVDREDDLKLGLHTSAITLGLWDVAAVVLCELLFLSIWTVAVGAQLVTLASRMVWAVAVVLSLGQVLWHYRLIQNRSPEGCFRAFRVNHWMGATLWAGLVAAYVIESSPL